MVGVGRRRQSDGRRGTNHIWFITLSFYNDAKSILFVKDLKIFGMPNTVPVQQAVFVRSNIDIH